MFTFAKKKSFWAFIVTIVFSVSVGLLVNTSAESLFNKLVSIAQFVQDKNALFGASLGITFLSALLISYVNKGIGTPRNNEKNAELYEKLKKEINALKVGIDQKASEESNDLNKIDVSLEEKKNLIEAAKKRIIGNTLLAADVSLKNDFNVLKHQVELDNHYSRIRTRLENEIDRLNTRGGVNLGIGAAIAFTGISYLAYAIINQSEYDDKLVYLMHMAPRISFVIVIELLAYFFLKLYKNGFDEVKYFQNELTNIESKVLGIKFLKDVRNEELMGEVIKNLMATERNFVLEKGQSTVALEKEKISQEEGRNMIEILKEIIKIKK
ncbi:hypothetical protein AB3N45_08755 [Enterobacter cloacae]|uniref:hypothetical protein n=1 Tax=Enterobacter cloacae TaxID=550 RepID=UPI002A828482|nr:hypothetical protein [Enterobacter cloacae]